MIKKIFVFILMTFFVNNVLMAEVVNTIVAVVGASPITSDDFMKRKNFLAAQSRGKKISDKDVYDDILEEHIMYAKLEELKYEIEDKDVETRIESMAKQYNLSKKQFIKEIEASGISFDEYRLVIKKQIAMESLYSTVVTPPVITDAEADKFYASQSVKNKAKFEGDTIVRLSWIFFKAKTFTEKGRKGDIAARVRINAAKGADFEKLAKTHSDDTKTKKYGGDLGYNLLADLEQGNMPIHITYGLNLVKSGSQVGTVSTVRETVGSGFWIVKITGIEKDQSSIRSRVKSFLSEDRSREAFLKWVIEEKEKVAVTIYSEIK